MTINYENHGKYPDKILIRKFQGEVCVEDILESWTDLFDSGKLKSTITGVINDLSVCDLKMNMADFKKLLDFLSENEILRSIKLAVITDSPKNVTFPKLAESNKELRIKAFSTLQAAEDWII